MSNQRFIILAFVAAAVIVGLSLRSAMVDLMAAIGWADSLVLNLVALSSIISIGAGVGTFLVLLRNERAVSFVDEVIAELFKVFWPGREETVNSTTVVLVTSLALALSLALYDFVWAKVTGVFLFSS